MTEYILDPSAHYRVQAFLKGKRAPSRGGEVRVELSPGEASSLKRKVTAAGVPDAVRLASEVDAKAAEAKAAAKAAAEAKAKAKADADEKAKLEAKTRVKT